MSFDINVFVFVSFLVVTIIVGLLSGRGVTTIRSYAVGDRNFSTATLASTIVATWVSGEFFFTILAESYSHGISFIWTNVFGNLICSLLIGVLFAPRMSEFLGSISIAEAMGNLFGTKVRIITTLSGFVAVSGIIAIQLQISGLLFEYALGINASYGIIFSGIIITLYSSLGGIKSVTFTDAIQFITLCVVIPTIAYFLFNSIENDQIIVDTITNHQLFDHSAVFSFSNPEIYFIFSLFLWEIIPSFNPAIFQRVAMAKNVKQVRYSFIIASIISMFLAAIICWIGVLMLSIYPNTEVDQIFGLIISDFSWITGFKGLVLAGIMAMVMSTVDSYINSSSVLLVHDLGHSLKSGFIKKELFVTRICSLMIGAISILLAMNSGSFLELLLWANMFYMPVVTVPFIMAIFGFRSSSKSVLIGMFAGVSTAMIWELFFKIAGVGGLIPGIFANFVFLLSSHYLLKQPGGWIGIKDPSPLIEIKKKRRQQLLALLHKIVSFDLIQSLKNNTPKADNFIAFLGVFIMISTFSGTNLLLKEVRNHYSVLLNILYPFTLCMSTALISYPLWLPKWKNTIIMPVFWNITMLCILICFSFFMVLISNFSEISLMIFMVNMIVISSLLNWRLSILYIVFGIFIALFCYKYYFTPYQIQINFVSLEFKIVYLLLLISSTLIIFLKPKQEHLEATEKHAKNLTVENKSLKRQNAHAKREIENLVQGVGVLQTQFEQKEGVLTKSEVGLKSTIKEMQQQLGQIDDLKEEFFRNLQHESNTPLTAIVSSSDILFNAYDKLDSKTIKSTIKDIITGSERLKTYISNIVDTSRLSEAAGSKLDKVIKLNLSNLVRERTSLYKKVFSDDEHKAQFNLEIDPDLMVECNEHYMIQLIDNLITNSDKYGKNSLIEISLRKMNSIMVEFKITDHGIGIPKEELHDVFKSFTTSSKTKTPSGGRGLGLALCQQVIDVHQGKILAESDAKNGTTFMFVIPFNYHYKSGDV